MARRVGKKKVAHRVLRAREADEKQVLKDRLARDIPLPDPGLLGTPTDREELGIVLGRPRPVPTLLEERVAPPARHVGADVRVDREEFALVLLHALVVRSVLFPLLLRFRSLGDGDVGRIGRLARPPERVVPCRRDDVKRADGGDEEQLVRGRPLDDVMRVVRERLAVRDLDPCSRFHPDTSAPRHPRALQAIIKPLLSRGAPMLFAIS